MLFWQKHNVKIIVDKFHAAKTLQQIKLSQAPDNSDEVQWIKLNNIPLTNIQYSDMDYYGHSMLK